MNLRIAAIVLAVAGAANADPIAFDSSLCLRADGDRRILWVATPPAATVSMTDDGTVTACRRKDDCSTVHVTGFVPTQTEGGPHDIAISPDGAFLIVGGNSDSKSMRIIRVKDGSLAKKIVNKRDPQHSCGAGIWLDGYVLAAGQACEEFDSTPFLTNGKTGAFIAPFANVTATADAIYAGVQLDGTRWAVAVSDYTDALSYGRVIAVNVANGKVLATAEPTHDGGATIREGAKQRTLAKLPACH
jgi:hypothetical protein